MSTLETDEADDDGSAHKVDHRPVTQTRAARIYCSPPQIKPQQKQHFRKISKGHHHPHQRYSVIFITVEQILHSGELL